MQFREFSIMADLSDKYLATRQQISTHPKSFLITLKTLNFT